MIAMFYQTSWEVVFRLDRVLAVHPLSWDDREENSPWCARIDGCDEPVRLSRAEAREVVELLEKRSGLV